MREIILTIVVRRRNVRFKRSVPGNTFAADSNTCTALSFTGLLCRAMFPPPDDVKCWESVVASPAWTDKTAREVDSSRVICETGKHRQLLRFMYSFLATTSRRPRDAPDSRKSCLFSLSRGAHLSLDSKGHFQKETKSISILKLPTL